MSFTRRLITAMLLFTMLFCAGCAPAPAVEEPPIEAEPELPLAEPAQVRPDAGAVHEPPALTEDEIWVATWAVYDSYMVVSAETPAASPQKYEACRKSMFINMSRARWDITFEEDGWAETFFCWLSTLPLDAERELPYLLLPYGSTDGAYAEAYHGALARQFMVHPYPLLRLIAAHKDWQHFCGGISYGSYPCELELYTLLKEMQTDTLLNQAEQDAITHMLERMADLYGQGDADWAENLL